MKYKKRILPLIIFVVLLISPFIFYFLGEKVFAIYFSIIFIYWLYRSFAFTVLGFVGYFYFKLKSHVAEDLVTSPGLPETLNTKHQTLNPYHLITIAVYNEEIEIIQKSLDSIISQDYEKDKILISISIEERRSTSPAIKLKNEIEKIYRDKVKLSVTIHPFGLDNEVPGAGSNKAWAEKNGVQLIHDNNIDIENVIVTIPDADTTFNLNYFKILAGKWTKSKKRNNQFFQTNFYKFDRSYLDANIFTRILSSGLSISILSSSFLRPKARYTFSCFSLSLSTLIKCDFTDPSIPIDDTTIFLRAIEKLDGDFECSLINSEIYVRPTFGKNYLDSLNEQYKQYKRWGWGVIAFLDLLSILKHNKKISFTRKLNLFFTAIEVFFVNKIIPILVFISLYLLKVNDQIFDDETIEFINLLLILNLLTLIPTLITKFLVVPKPKFGLNYFFFLIKLVIEMPISAITLFTFGFIPYLHAALEIMISPLSYSKIEWSKKSVTQE
jgi:hypothetical protein